MKINPRKPTSIRLDEKRLERVRTRMRELQTRSISEYIVSLIDRDLSEDISEKDKPILREFSSELFSKIQARLDAIDKSILATQRTSKTSMVVSCLTFRSAVMTFCNIASRLKIGFNLSKSDIAASESASVAETKRIFDPIKTMALEEDTANLLTYLSSR